MLVRELQMSNNIETSASTESPGRSPESERPASTEKKRGQERKEKKGFLEKLRRKRRRKAEKEKETETPFERAKEQVKRVADSDRKIKVLKDQIRGLERTIEDTEILSQDEQWQEVRDWFNEFKKTLHLINEKTYSEIKKDIRRIRGARNKARALRKIKGKLDKEYSGEQKARRQELEPLAVVGRQVESFSQLPGIVLELKERNIELDKQAKPEKDTEKKGELEKQFKEGESKLKRVEEFRRGWQEGAKEYVTEKIDADWVSRREERLRETERAINRLIQESKGESSVVVWQQVEKGINLLFREEIKEPEEMPEILRGALRDWYREEVDKLSKELLRETDWKVPEEEKKQEDWLRGRIVELRKLDLAPDLITSSTVWLNLIQWLSKEGVKDSVRKEFSARLNLLRFGLGCSKLADPNLSIEALFENSGYLTSVKTVLAIPDIQTAYNLLENRAKLYIKEKKQGIKKNERSLSPLSVDNQKKKEELLGELAEKFCETKEGLSKADAEAFLGEAFDIYFYLGNLQHIEDSESRPNAVHKVLNFSKWAEGKFPKEMADALAQPYYQDEKGVAIGPALGIGVRKPLHALYSTFEVEELTDKDEMGFSCEKGREKIFNWRGEKCVGVSVKDGEKEGGTYIFKKNGMEIEAIVYEARGKKRIVVADIKNPRAKVIAEALGRAKEGWFPGYFRELRNGERTRLLFLEEGLMSDPIGSLPGEIEDFPSKRLIKAAATGSLFAASIPRRYEKEPPPSFMLRNEDLIEAYLDGVLKYSKSKRGKRIEGYRIGSDHTRAVILTEVAKRDLITVKGERRLEKKHLGGRLGRIVLPKIALYTSIFRVPGMKFLLFRRTIGNFFDLLFQYTFEGFGFK